MYLIHVLGLIRGISYTFSIDIIRYENEIVSNDFIRFNFIRIKNITKKKYK